MGFSNGCAELTLKKPPPLVPSCLMATCEAAGPTASTLLRAQLVPLASAVGCSSVAVWIGPKVCTTPCETSTQRQHQRQRQQDVERAAGQIHPEVADGPGGVARKPARQRDQHRHAGGRRDEVLDRQAEHLGQVAQRGLAAVALPVGVGGEADGGVEGESAETAPKPCGLSGRKPWSLAAGRRRPASPAG